MHRSSLKSSLLAAVLAASWALPLSVSAEKPAEIYSHEHRESHTTTRTESSTRTSSSTTSTHTSSSVSVDKEGTAGILGGLLVPNPNRKVPGLVRTARESHLAPVFAGRDSKGLWGLWDARGREILAPRYKSLEAASQGLLEAREGKKELLYFTREGLPAQAPSNPAALTAFRENGHWGFRDAEQRTVLAPVYKEVRADFSEGIAFVVNAQGKSVAIDTQGRELFAAPYDQVFPFRDGLAETRRTVRSFNWASLASVALGAALWDQNVYMPDQPLSLTWDGVKRGYIDSTGQVIVDDRNDAVFPMTLWGTFVKDKGELWFVNRQGRVLFGPGKYDIDGGGLDEQEGLAAVRDKGTGKFGIVDISDGSLRLPFAWDGVQFLGQQRMLVKEGNLSRLVSEATGQVLRTWQQPVTLTPFGSQAETTWIREGKTWRLMDRDGNLLSVQVPADVTQTASFQGQAAPAKGKQGWGLMDAQGSWLVQGLKEVHSL